MNTEEKKKAAFMGKVEISSIPYNIQTTLYLMKTRFFFIQNNLCEYISIENELARQFKVPQKIIHIVMCFNMQVSVSFAPTFCYLYFA